MVLMNNKPFVEPPFVQPAGTIDPEVTQWPHPIERILHEPDEVVFDDLLINQAENQLWLALKLSGEIVTFYRQKEYGELCSCVDKDRQNALSWCPICYGTKFVGGYDYLGKSLMQFPQAPVTKIITETGLKLQEQVNPWTMNKPVLKERDFLIRKIKVPMSGSLRIIDEPVVRGNYGDEEDVLGRINVHSIWKISDSPNTENVYIEGTDYILQGGEMAVEDTGNSDLNYTRTIRVLGKKSPILSVQNTYTQPLNVGLVTGMTVHVNNNLLNPTSVDATLQEGIESDYGYYVIKITSHTQDISDKTLFPLISFKVTISGDRIIWLTDGNKPTSGNTYYVTYDYIQTFTRRYQLVKVNNPSLQGLDMLQSVETALLDPTHPIYRVGSIFDNGIIIDFKNGITKEMIKQIRESAGRSPGNTQDGKYNQEVGY